MIKPTSIEASSEWSSPSNLAIVKYWGKRNIQEPINPSVSFSLQKAFTKTKVTASSKSDGGFSFYFNGEKQYTFEEKISKFLSKSAQYLPFINNHHLKIESANTFPHSSGVASSASAMSALALCLVSLHNLSIGKTDADIDFTMASGIARQGSGSACRSLFGGWTIWGKYRQIRESSDMYALRINSNDIHPIFQNVRDSILIVNPSPKKVSSTHGHQLMENHPYLEARIKQAHLNTERLLSALKAGNWQLFTEVAENEAMSLHGLMMSSSPSYTLLHPNSIRIIDIIRQKRKKSGLPISFSMDAGPNIHLLYPQSDEKNIKQWIRNDIEPLCYNGTVLHDQAGNGPVAHQFKIKA